jgi:hypothetical protein
MQKSVVAIACVAAGLILLPSATAGGWWSSVRLDRARVAVGQELRVHASVMFRSVEEAEAAQNGEAQGAFYVYLLRKFDYSVVQRAMREASPRDWWSVGNADAFRVGRVVISGQESNLAVANASFRVPEVPPGRYTVMLCDVGCAHPLADVIPTLPKQLTVTVPRRAGGTPLVQRVGWLVVGVLLGALLGFALGRLRAASPESISVAWLPSDDVEVEQLLGMDPGADDRGGVGSAPAAKPPRPHACRRPRIRGHSDYACVRGILSRRVTRRLRADHLDDPAALAFAVELEEEHTLPGAEAELAVSHRDRLTG